MEEMVVTNFNTYLPPGVYVESDTASIVTPAGVPASTVCLVGLSRGYQTATDSVPLVATAQVLSNKGVLPDSHESPNLAVTRIDGTVLVENTDYALVRGALPGDATTIARVSGTTVPSGEVVLVSYCYADAEYYAPKIFQDYTSVEAVYGPSMVSSLPSNPNDTQVASPLSFGARIAFENGAATLICVAIEPPVADPDGAGPLTGISLRQRFVDAYSKVESNAEVALIVPVFHQMAGTTDNEYTALLPLLLSDLRSHCVGTASSGSGRIGFAGADVGYDDTTTGFDDLAAGLSEKRMVLAYPNRLNYFNSLINQSTEVGGCYLAAAYAGRLAAQQVNRGLTRTQIFGFVGIPDELIREMTVAFKNNLSSSGVSVTEYGRQQRLIIRHGVSTDVSDLLAQEVSVTRCNDLLYRLVYDGVDAAGLIGEPISNDLTMQVKGIVGGILESAQADLVIREYVDLQVRQQATPNGNPTVVEVQFTYRPFLPLNYIVVSFAMDLSTGTVDITDTVTVA